MEQVTSEQALKQQFATLYDLIQESDEPALRCVDGRQPLNYTELKQFVKDGVNLIQWGITKKDRVCVIIPNGPELALCFLSLCMRCTYAPLSLSLSPGEFEFEYEDLPAKAVIVLADAPIQAPYIKLAKDAGLIIIKLTPDPKVCGRFTLSSDHPKVEAKEEWGGRQDLALVLHTSGTTKKPKIVPLTHENICVGAICIRSTVQMTKQDICLNMMPLFHIHGLIVNILATIVAGSSVICTPMFDKDRFFDWNRDLKPTWYSAVPTMHVAILHEGERRVAAGQPFTHSLQLIRNCSAALLPSVAQGLEKLFSPCLVMPTYAMTESMPIASNPRSELRDLKTVGRAAGPELRVLYGDRVEDVPLGEQGEVAVRGGCVTAGYEYRPHMDVDPNVEALTEGWLRTGDKGSLDERGYLTLAGRFKEIINRAGEKISPFAVEEELRQFGPVLDCIAFAAPHLQLGEVVGVAVVTRQGQLTTLAAIRDFLRSTQQLEEKWLPELVVWMSGVPKGPTGKPARIGLAKRCRIIPLDSELKGFCSFEAGEVPERADKWEVPNLLRPTDCGGCEGPSCYNCAREAQGDDPLFFWDSAEFAAFASKNLPAITAVEAC